MNASNLIRLDDFSDKNRLKELEQAANSGQVDNKTIFNIYSQIQFSLNELVNAKNNYRKLDFNEARPLIYQKYLLSEDNDTKIEYLLLLEELFKKDKLLNIYSKFLSDEILEIGIENFSKNIKK